MGKPSPEDVDRWLEAAGKTRVSDSMRDLIVDVAQFIQNTLKNDPAACLSGIDFSKPIKKLSSLPDGIYVQWRSKKTGAWFTSTGVTGDDVGLSILGRTRELYRPAGSVAALRSTAKSIKDTWTPKRLFQPVDASDPRVRALIDRKFARLKAEASSLDDDESAKLYDTAAKRILSRIGQQTKGGGIQYLVGNPGRMKKI